LEATLVVVGKAEVIATREARSFHGKLEAERTVPTIVALRERLEEIRREELERYRRDPDSCTAAEEHALEAFTTRMVDRIASQLARELKQVPEKPEHDRLAAAVCRLFRLSLPKPALAPR
jgi:glutamyl-tRNA reductase